MKKVNFSKMVATGNDFVVVDNRGSVLGSRLSPLAKKLCDRKFGIGADGLLVVENSKKGDFRMRIFNPDGSEPDMCGNGSRCIALFAKLKKIASANMRIQTAAGMLSADVSKNGVKINMTDPYNMRLGIKLKVNNKNANLHYINTGVPHVAYMVKNIDKVDISQIGRTIRFHKEFAPEGTNVNFVQKKSKCSISVRTYERGVEEETLACGTGSVASAIISSLVSGCKSPVKVCTKGGNLNIYFENANNKITNVFLEGQAEEVFTGKIKISI